MGYNFFMTKYGIMLAIMDMVSAKSDVNAEKEKVCFCVFYWKIDKNTKKRFQNI